MYVCNHCRDMSEGFIYVCFVCDFMLDVKCASLTEKDVQTRLKETTTSSSRSKTLCRFNHDHELGFFNFKHNQGGVVKCDLCYLPIGGPTYACRSCKYTLHESCLEFPGQLQLPLVLPGCPLHPAIIGYSPVFDEVCFVCRHIFRENSIVYTSQQYQYLNCHLSCANSLSRPLKSNSHEHDLFYLGMECQKLFANSTDSPSQCDKCNESFRGEPFYACIRCQLYFHLSCVPLPQSIKSKCHIHTFTLKDSFVEDDSGEYYCDVCEEERQPEDHVYYCEECRGLFVAHIDCVLHQVEEFTPAVEIPSNLLLDIDDDNYTPPHRQCVIQ